jgi:acyl-CoA reductase-like NAD-dependent aldehyde dehydrogenase
MELAAKNIVKSSMELGGNAPVLVFDDADLERAIDGAILAKMRNGGQTCVAANRIMVQEGISDAFIEGFTEKMAAFVVGNPLAEGVTLGPMIDDKAIERLEFLTDDAVEKGASITTGGTKWEGPGSFFAPTVLTNVNHTMKIMTEETFGPILPVMPFADEDEAIALANGTIFGLSGAVFAKTDAEAHRIGLRMQAGAISLNDSALTAIIHDGEKQSFKASGMGGTRMGAGAMRRFMRQRAFLTKMQDVASPWWYQV